MKISVIIPSYNSCDLLKQSLDYYREQLIPDVVKIEIIVVDDGSTDGTDEFVHEYSAEFPHTIKYIFRPRDTNSCRARARNLGIQKADGDIVILQDCGIIVDPQFINTVFESFFKGPSNQVILHRVAGLDMTVDTMAKSTLEELNPSTVEQIAQSLLNSEGWCDRRDGLFRSVADNLHLLSAPWALGWSCLMSVPRLLALEAGGFDESFMGWGAEDVDFSYRLYLLGALFRSLSHSVGLHIPHSSSEDYDGKLESNRGNEIKMHQKHYSLDTEVYLCYAGIYYNQILSRFQHLVLNDMLPSYPVEFAKHISKTYLTNGGKSLLFGQDDIIFLNHLKTSHLFTLNPTMSRHLQELFPDRTIELRLGYNTPYPDRFFEVIVVTDFIRTLGDRFLKGVVQELFRISEKVLIILTDRFISPATLRDGSAQWISYDALINSIESNANATLENKETMERHHILVFQT